MISFNCKDCGAQFNVRDDKAGGTGKCPKCGASFLVPSPTSVSPSPAAEADSSLDSLVEATSGYRRGGRLRRSLALRGGIGGRVIAITACGLLVVVLIVLALSQGQHSDDKRVASPDTIQPDIAPVTEQPEKRPEMTTSRPQSSEEDSPLGRALAALGKEVDRMNDLQARNARLWDNAEAFRNGLLSDATVVESIAKAEGVVATAKPLEPKLQQLEKEIGSKAIKLQGIRDASAGQALALELLKIRKSRDDVAAKVHQAQLAAKELEDLRQQHLRLRSFDAFLGATGKLKTEVDTSATILAAEYKDLTASSGRSITPADVGALESRAAAVLDNQGKLNETLSKSVDAKDGEMDAAGLATASVAGEIDGQLSALAKSLSGDDPAAINRSEELAKSFCHTGKAGVESLKKTLGQCHVILEDKTVHAILGLTAQLAQAFEELRGASERASEKKNHVKPDAALLAITRRVRSLCESLDAANRELDKKLPERTKERLRLEADVVAIKTVSDRARAMQLLEEIEAIEGHEERLKAATAERYEGALKALAASAAKVDAPFEKITKPATLKAFVKSYDEWSKTAKDALAYIFDDGKYPVPEKAKSGWIAGRDIQTNQAIVEGKVENAISRWNRLGAEFLSQMGAPARSVGSPGGGGLGAKVEKGQIAEPDNRRLGVLTYNIVDPSEDSAALVRSIAAAYGDYAEALKYFNFSEELAKRAGVAAVAKPEPSALAIASSALCAEDFGTAAAKRPAGGSDEIGIFRLVGNMYLLSRSVGPGGEWKGSEKKTLALSNLYRLALGLSPMQGNKHIHDAATEHSQWQEARREMTHYRPEKSMKTFSDRMAFAKYTGSGCTENIAGSSGEEPLWGWRCDAGHHRNLINRQSRAAGVGDRGMVTFDTGRSTEDEQLDKVYSILDRAE